MKIKLGKRLVSIVLSLCMIFTMVPMSVTSVSSAEEEGLIKKTLPVWTVNQFYTRGLTAAGTILVKVANSTESEEFQSAAAFINKWVCGGNTMGSDVAEIKKMCYQILDSLERVENQLNQLIQDSAQKEIKDAFNNYTAAWTSDVEDVIASYGLANALASYKTYLEYANSYKTGEEIIVGGVRKVATAEMVEEQKNKFTNDLVGTDLNTGYHNYALSGATGNNQSVDNVLYNCIDSLVNKLKMNSLGTPTRYVDRAAQYAYLAFPYSSQQSDSVQLCFEKQSTEISLVIMMYQEFLGQRAEYFQEIYNNCNLTGDERETKYKELEDIYNASFKNFSNLLYGENGVTDRLVDWMNSQIHIENSQFSSHLYLNTYLSSSSARNVTLKNTNYLSKDKLTFDFYEDEVEKGYDRGEKYSMYDRFHMNDAEDGKTEDGFDNGIENFSAFVNESLKFNKDAAVSVGGSEGLAKITPFYVLDTVGGNNKNMYIRNFDMKWDISLHPDIHMATPDYYNLIHKEYSDGFNTYSSVKSSDEFKALINPTYYDAYCKNNGGPYTYFSKFLGYTENNNVYLLYNDLLSADNTGPGHSGTYYTEYPVIKLNSNHDYTDGWSQRISQRDHQKDESNTDMYAVVLKNSANTSTYYSQVETVVKGEGVSDVTITSLDINDEYEEIEFLCKENTHKTVKAQSGSSLKVILEKMDPEYAVKSIKVQYHNDASDLSVVTDEDVLISEDVADTLYCDEDGTFSFPYPVPYSNVTIVIETEMGAHQYNEDGFCINCNSYQPAEIITEGSYKGYYEITNVGQLYWFAACVNKHEDYVDYWRKIPMFQPMQAILAQDLDMSVAPDDCKWAPIGKKNVSNPAGGALDGRYHTISNIDGMLFGSVYNWFICHLGIVGGTFYPNTEYADATGSIAGDCDYSYVYNCYSTATGQGINTVGGGIVGKMSGFLYNCYFAGSIYGDRTMPIGGIVGSSYGGKYSLEIADCYNYSDNDTLDSKNGELVGFLHQGSTVENCYYADYNGSGRKAIGTSESSTYTVDSVSTASAYTYQDFQSGKITHLLSNGVTDGKQYWYQNIDNGLTPDKYPVLVNNGQNTVYKVDLPNKTYSNYEKGFAFDELDKDENGRFIIRTYDELCWVSNKVNSGDKTYVNGSYIVANDIVAPNGTSFVPIGREDVYSTDNISFAGVFDGGNYTISNLKINGNDYVGLFSSTEGTIKNVNLSNCDVSGSNFVGGICGINLGVVSNCSFDGTVYGKKSVGGICGIADAGTVLKSFNSGLISGEVAVGGVCGLATNAVIDNCYNTGEVSAKDRVGGIVGEGVGKFYILNCYNVGKISGETLCQPVCGNREFIIGLPSTGAVKNCFYLGTSETDSFLETTFKTAEQFASGEVAYLLNSTTTDGTQAWYQNIDNGLTPDSSPVLVNNDKNTVYKVDLEDKTYSNVQKEERDPSLIYKEDLRTYQRILNPDRTLSEKSQIAMGYGTVDNENMTITVYMADTAERMGVLKNQGVDGKKGEFTLQGNYEHRDETSAELLKDPSFEEPDIYTDGNGCIFISQPKDGTEIPKLTVEYKAKPIGKYEPVTYTLEVEIIETDMFKTGMISGGRMLSTLNSNDPDYNVLVSERENINNNDSNKDEDTTKPEDNNTSTPDQPANNTPTDSGAVKTGDTGNVMILLLVMLSAMVMAFGYRRRKIEE